MFCPRCATENKNEQRYCRQCGLTLPAVRLALEGRVDEAIQKYKKSETILGWGFVLLLIGALNAGVNAFFSAWQSAIFSGAIGFVIGVVLILMGLSRMGRARKMLDPPEKQIEPDAAAIDESRQADAALPPASITEEIIQTPARRHSVIDNTTINLKRPQ
jgi:uncharacterized membrane protein YvbJ